MSQPQGLHPLSDSWLVESTVWPPRCRAAMDAGRHALFAIQPACRYAAQPRPTRRLGCRGDHRRRPGEDGGRKRDRCVRGRAARPPTRSLTRPPAPPGDRRRYTRRPTRSPATATGAGPPTRRRAATSTLVYVFGKLIIYTDESGEAAAAWLRLQRGGADPTVADLVIHRRHPHRSWAAEMSDGSRDAVIEQVARRHGECRGVRVQRAPSSWELSEASGSLDQRGGAAQQFFGDGLSRRAADQPQDCCDLMDVHHRRRSTSISTTYDDDGLNRRCTVHQGLGARSRSRRSPTARRARSAFLFAEGRRPVYHHPGRAGGRSDGDPGRVAR